MKVQIRSSVFETNSSSVHSISVCNKTDYDRWINNEVKFNPSKNTFLENTDADEYNVDNFDKRNYYYMDISLFNDDDLKIPVIVEILYSKEYAQSGDVDAYLSYDRFFNASAEFADECYEKVENIYEDSVEFGYTGRN